MKRILSRFSSLIFLSIVLVLLASCRPVVSLERSEDYAFFPSGNNPGELYDFSAIFENFWSGMNHNYVFWDRESVDWDAIYDEYKPQFAALSRFDAGVDSPVLWTDKSFLASLGSAFSLFQKMTKDLSDGHLQLVAEDPYGILKIILKHENPFIDYNNICPSLYRKWDEIKGGQETRGMFRLSNWSTDEPAENGSLLDRAKTYDFINGTIANHVNFKPDGKDGYFNIVKKDYEDEISARISQFMPRIAAGYIKNANILYIYAPYLLYYTCLEEIPILSQGGQIFPTDFITVMDIFFAGLKDPDLEGVIVDLRGVVGGSPKDLTYLWGRMITDPLTIGHQRGKSGEGRLDYGPWVPLRILPAPEGEGMPDETRGKIPVVALADEFTSSGAEFSIMAVHAMPNGYVIGSSERTIGTTSGPFPNQKYNAGVFEGSPLFSSLTVTGAQSRHLDGNVYEGVGIPMNALGKGEVVDQNWNEFFAATQTERKDTVLERAIKYIKEKNP